MDFALKVVFSGTVSSDIPDRFFRLDETNKDKSSYFEFVICIGKKLYAYGFEILLEKKKINEERLIELGPVKDKKVFYRNTSMCTYSYNKSLVEEDYRSRFEIYIQDHIGTFPEAYHEVMISDLIVPTVEAAALSPHCRTYIHSHSSDRTHTYQKQWCILRLYQVLSDL